VTSPSAEVRKRHNEAGGGACVRDRSIGDLLDFSGALIFPGEPFTLSEA
jgi:hypothetical protein